MTPDPTTFHSSSWPGALLSLAVPGFGCFRAGKTGRWLVWYLGFYALSIPAALLLIIPSIPFWYGFGSLLAGAVLLYIWMVVDCCRPGRLQAWGWGVFALALAAQALLPLPGSFIVRPFNMPTNGMAPTLRGYNWDGNTHCDRVLVSRLAYVFGTPQRGDIIVFRTKGITHRSGRPLGGEFFTKRVVAFPGEQIRIAEGKIFINGDVQRKSDGIPPVHYVTGPEARPSQYLRTPEEEFLVPEDSYFVLADNSSHSMDSRFWGPVPAGNVFGKVIDIYFPFHRAGPPVYTGTEANEQVQRAPISAHP